MKINEFIAYLPAMYYSALEEGGPSYYLQSDPGGGKTSAYRTFPKTMARIDPTAKYGFAVINGANFTLMTGGGFMIPTKDAKGRDIAKFTLPSWYYTEKEHLPLDQFDGGVLLVDEYDKLGQDEKKIVGEAALSKVLCGHQLPPNWVVMFAGNYLHNRSGGGRDLDHMILRRITLELQNDVEATVDYFKSINVLPETIQFAEENPQLLFEPQPEDQRPRCCPRTLHQCDIMLRSLMSAFETDKIPTDPLAQELVKGGIGLPAQTQFIKTIRLGQEAPSYEEVIANPMKIALPVRPDALRLMSYKMASKVQARDAEKVISFMSRMPQEFTTIFVQLACLRNYELALEPHFLAWCGKYSALTAVLNRYKVTDK